MGIDLQKLEMLQKLASSIDNEYGDKNSKLDTDKEITIFEGEIAKLTAQGTLTADDNAEIKNIFGLEASSGVKTTSTPAELSKKEKKRYQNAVLDSVEKYVEAGIKPEHLMAELKKEYKNPEYAPILNEVQALLDAVNKIGYNSRDDIEGVLYLTADGLTVYRKDGIYDQVKKQLENANKDDKFHKNILKQLVVQAKEVQVQKEFKALVSMYIDVKDIMADTEIVKNKGDHFKAYAEIVKDELKKNEDLRQEVRKIKSKLKKELGHEPSMEEVASKLKTKMSAAELEDRLAASAWNASYTNEAYERLVDYIKNDVKNVVRAQLRETEGTTEKKVRKEIKKQNTADDPYHVDARKDLKQEVAIAARHNNVEKTADKLDSISEKAIIRGMCGKDIEKDDAKFLSFKLKKAKALLEKLNRSYLAEHKNEDGTYNLRPLSEEIQKLVGKDYYVNTSTQTEMAEMHNIKKRLEDELNITLNDTEVGMLIDLCGIDRETKKETLKRNLLKKILPGAVGGFLGGASAIGGYIHNTQMITMPGIDNSTVSNMKQELLSQGIVPDITDNGDGTSNVVVLQENVLNFIGLNALSGAALGTLQAMAMSLIFGDPEAYEQACISITDYDNTDTRYTLKENFVEYIRGRYPEWKADLLAQLIETYQLPEGQEPTATSDWDHEAFFNQLRKIAGLGSVLNCDELRGNVLYPDKRPPEPPKPPVPPTPVRCNLEKDSEKVDTTFTHEFKYGDSWEEIVKAYFPSWADCFDKMYNKGGAIQALKRAVATKADGTLDEQLYKKLLAGYIPSSITIPEQLGDCKRDENGKVKFRQPEGKPVGYIGKVGIETGYNSITLTDCDGNSATGKTVGEALTKLNEKTGKDYTEADILPDEQAE